MPDAISQSGVLQVIGVFVECIFYGIHVVTFVASLHAILSSGPESTWSSRLRSNKWMFLVVLLMFSLSTLNLALGLVRILQAIVYNARSSGPALANQKLGQDWVNLAKSLSVPIQTMIADVVLIHRCWVIYGKSRRVVIFPIFLWIAGVACTIAIMYIEVLLALTSGSGVNRAALFPLIISFWSTTITLNLYSTTLIIFRIWRVIGETAAARASSVSYPWQPQSRLENAMRIVIESGLIYTITSIFVLTTPIKDSDAIFITTAAEIQVIGIAFNLILIRVKKAADHAMRRREQMEQTTFASPINFVAHETGASTVNAKAIAFHYVDVERRVTSDSGEKNRFNA